MIIVYDSVIFFLDVIEGEGQDEYGDPARKKVLSPPIYAKVLSIRQSEFYQAHTVGKKPEKKFIISDSLDYGGQEFLIHGDFRYKILRTYQTDRNELEITCYGGVRDACATISC